jgi:uroporphyrinogen-III synthase
LFAALVDQAGLNRDTISIAAISPAATAAAGGGWRSVAAAAAPTDSALLELAADLCQNDGDGRHGL